METSPPDLEALADRYRAARNRYKPAHLRVLFIVEAPPCALDRYFYFEDVRKQDSLFLEIAGVLYPGLKAAYLASGRDGARKAALLAQLQSDGYWLLDLSELPHQVTGSKPEAALPSLLTRVAAVAGEDTRVILIKANVYDCCYAPLKAAGYAVSPERIPFPGSGQQGVFRAAFARALAE